MKQTTFIILFVFLFLNSFSQNSFELLLDHDNAQRPTGLIIDSNGDYVICSQEFTHTNNGIEYNSMLTKISQTGEILNTKYFNTEENTVFSDIINTENNDYIVIGSVYADNFDEMHSFIIRLDSDFNIIWNKKIILNKKILTAKAKFNSNSEILIHGGLKNSDNSYSTYIYKINIDGTLLNSAFFYYYNRFINFFDILEKENNSGYYLFELTTVYSALEIDTEFNVIEKHQMGALNLNGCNSFWFSDTTYIISNNKTDTDLSVSILDTTHNTEYYSFRNEHEGHEFLAFWDNLSFIDKNNIYMLGTYNFSPNPYETEPSWLCVNNLNDSLGLTWQKIIGGDAYYNATNIIATEDGGCFISSTRSDNTNSYDYDMYFLKLDPNGNITHINGEPSEQKAKEVILYPNPATTELTIQKAVQVGNCNVEFYNMEGKKVFYQELISNTTKIDISSLQKGSYIYKITDNSKIIESGKWIKQ